MTEPFARPTPRLARAMDIARIVHDGAVRKGTEIPYIQHPVAVAHILERHGYGEDLVIAGLLHDTVEDAKYGDLELQRRLCEAAGRGRLPVPSDAWAFRSAFLEFIQAEFGQSVFELVMAVTETKNDGRPARDWLERKKEQLNRLTEASPDEAALKAADALHNIECTLHDVRRAGLGVLDRFRGGALVVWHYSAIAQLASERMPTGVPLAAAVVEAAGAFSAAVRSLRPEFDRTARYPPPAIY
jgi:(p)ppGpp synthase/HD superfamily hydrolase